MQRVGVAQRALAQPLQATLDLEDRLRRQQLAELGLAEELAQLRVIDAERLRAALGERRVAVVDEVRDVREEQRRRERRRRASRP